ncbi:MAG: hypothetical protein IPM91_09385 [Bacteroidetes bacterium]|nr:hypothetical protein [Bacteroidota bacterium]
MDAFWPANITDLRTPYILRDYRGQTLLLQPFQYNAMTSTLRVYTEMTVKFTPSHLFLLLTNCSALLL